MFLELWMSSALSSHLLSSTQDLWKNSLQFPREPFVGDMGIEAVRQGGVVMLLLDINGEHARCLTDAHHLLAR